MRILGFIPGIAMGGIVHPNDVTEDAFQPLEDSFGSLEDTLAPIEKHEEAFNAVDDPLGDFHGDIKYTPCQAELLRRNNIEISDSNIEKDIDDDEYCDQGINASENHRGAGDNSVQYWKDNFNEATNRYKIPYMFDGSHSAVQMDTIRRKLAEFRQETCIDLIEIPWEETYDGPFAEKFDNVFSVS